jgi:hypothetical protein
MLGKDIVEYFKLHDDVNYYFDGVYAINQIPRFLRKRHFIIVNTSRNDEMGKHWFCVCHFNDQLEVFDSLSTTATFIKAKLGKLRNLRTFDYNISAVQNETSVNCGLFVIYFGSCRALNPDLTLTELIQNIFSVDKNENDVIVQQYFDHGHFYEI